MPLIPQGPSSYAIEPTCQIENLGLLLEELPKPFGLFNPRYQGRFVEVGGFDGPTYSNVWQFVKAGWGGLIVEPMRENLELLFGNLSQLERHNITVEPVACDDHEGLLPMFFEREGSRRAAEGQLTHQIPTKKLDDLLEKYFWQPDFDVIVIDVEDHELSVLRGFDLAKWRPKLAIMETHMPQRINIHEIFDPLYRTYYEDGLNTMFTRRDWHL